MTGTASILCNPLLHPTTAALSVIAMSVGVAEESDRRGRRDSDHMKLPPKRFLVLSISASLLGGVGLAAYELNELHQAIAAAQEIAASIAAGLGGGAASQSTTTVDVSLCFGLIPIGRVDNPDLVIAVGDFILGTLITAFALVVAYALVGVVRRNSPKVASAEDSGGA